jgi:crotonobetainyl-CoA:carnitine CoA-transferase CaiB-like acyl-CoA transferase
LTALFERERTGRGRLVEVAMQEAAYTTLTSQLHAYFETGKAPPRTGNASHGRVPLNVYPTNDGYVAMNIAVEEQNMHERGMLEWIEHDEIGRIVVPTTPLRIHGADPVDTVPSPKLGQHNREIYGDWLGLSAVEIAALEQDGVI